MSRRCHTLVADGEARGERLDLFLAAALAGTSRKAIKRALDRGQVFVDGRTERRAGYRLEGKENLRITVDLSEPPPPPPEVKLLYCDEALLAIDKPAGLPSHATASGRPNALEMATLQWGGEESPILLHRLDAETSGALLFARSKSANRHLAARFAGREVEKLYLALVAGAPPESFQVRDHLRADVRGKTVKVTSGGKRAATDFRTVSQGDGFALVEARLHTGRTHQIRVHLAGEGFPILGDRLYGGPSALCGGREVLPVRRHLLHAWKIGLEHPSGERIHLIAPPPEDFIPFLDRLPEWDRSLA